MTFNRVKLKRLGGGGGRAVADAISSTANVLKKLPRKEGRFGAALYVQLPSV
jgi:hypothetical protein